jgi:CRP-like cAMP-binding protein
VKERKKAEIDKFRDAILGLGFTYNSHTFDSDLSSIVRLNMVLTAVNSGITLPANFVWRDKSNVDVPTTAADLAGMVGTCIVTANAVFQTAWTKKAEVDAAVTLGQVAAVTWSDPRLNWIA